MRNITSPSSIDSLGIKNARESLKPITFYNLFKDSKNIHIKKAIIGTMSNTNQDSLNLITIIPQTFPKIKFNDRKTSYI